jgi:hypothetical protein
MDKAIVQNETLDGNPSEATQKETDDEKKLRELEAWYQSEKDAIKKKFSEWMQKEGEEAERNAVRAAYRQHSQQQLFRLVAHDSPVPVAATTVYPVALQRHVSAIVVISTHSPDYWSRFTAPEK